MSKSTASLMLFQSTLVCCTLLLLDKNEANFPTKWLAAAGSKMVFTDNNYSKRWSKNFHGKQEGQFSTGPSVSLHFRVGTEQRAPSIEQIWQMQIKYGK